MEAAPDGASKPGRARFAVAASGFVSAVFNTVALLLIARDMGPEILGTLGFLLSFVGLLFFVGDMGNSLAFRRVLEKGYQFQACYRAYQAARLRMTAAMAVASAVLIAVYAYLLAPGGHTPLHPASLAVMLGYFVVLNLAGIWVTALAIKRRRPMNELAESAVRMAAVMALLWLMPPVGDQSAVFQLAFIYLLAGTIGMMLARNSARRLKVPEEGDEEVEVEFMEAASRLMPYVAMAGLVLNLDKVILWLFSDFAELGAYFGAQRITVFIAASGITVEALLADALRGHIAKGDGMAAARTLQVTERYVSLVVLPVACFYVLFPGPLLATFLGAGFAGADLVVPLLAAAGFLAGIGSPHVTYLVHSGQAKDLAIVGAAGLGALLAAALVLVPGWNAGWESASGMNGAAIAMLASAAATYATARAITWRRLGCAPHRRMLVHLWCGGVMMATLNFAVWYFSIEMTFAWICAFAVLGAVVYTACLYLAGEMLRRDYHEFRDLTRPE